MVFVKRQNAAAKGQEDGHGCGLLNFFELSFRIPLQSKAVHAACLRSQPISVKALQKFPLEDIPMHLLYFHSKTTKAKICRLVQCQLLSLLSITLN